MMRKKAGAPSYRAAARADILIARFGSSCEIAAGSQSRLGSRALTRCSGCDRYVRLHHPRPRFSEPRRLVNRCEAWRGRMLPHSFRVQIPPRRVRQGEEAVADFGGEGVVAFDGAEDRGAVVADHVDGLHQAVETG